MKKNFVIGLLGIISFFSLGFAYEQSREAQYQRDLAEFHRQEAEKLRELAAQAQFEADAQGILALEAKNPKRPIIAKSSLGSVQHVKLSNERTKQE